MIKQKVLIVDDASENIAVLNSILKEDYDIYFAKSGKGTLEQLNKVIPDIILLDIIMPDMDGYEVCEAIKKTPKWSNIPIIFVTAKDQAGDEVRGLDMGAVDYITKPVTPAIVKARLQTHLALHDQNKELERKVAQRTKEIDDTRLQVIQKLSIASEYKDNDTGGHIMRMSQYTYHIAIAYGLSEHHSNILKNAAPMHDIGKIGIPDSIVLKKGKLDASEWDTMTTHCKIGASIIDDQSCELLSTAYIVALQHHEKWNGKGYPNGLSGENIDINARIVAIADVFDALTSTRPYKEAWDNQRAIDLINEESGIHFDPDVVKAFNEVIPKIIEVKNMYQ